MAKTKTRKKMRGLWMAALLFTGLGCTAAADGQKAQFNNMPVLAQDQAIAVEAYNINDYNYFKLRDIGQAFDFGIGWDNASKTITIDTSAGYTA